MESNKNYKKKEHIVNSIKLLKVENSYSTRQQTYTYSVMIEGFEDEFIIDSNSKIEDVVGMKFSYKINKETNDIIDFMFD
jgi:hypothetical protein